MPEPVKQIANTGPSITDILNTLNPMFGGGKTTQTSTSYSTPDAKSLQDSDLILQKIFADMDPANIDAMVGNIIERARQAFGPTLLGANAAGVRSYSDTVLESLKNEAIARSVGEASAAKLKAIQEGNQTAAQLTANRMNATKQTTSASTSKTGPSNLGKATGLLTLGSYGNELLKKLKKITPNSPIDDVDLASGGEGVIADQNAFPGTEGGGITSVEAGAGEVPLAAAGGGGGATIVPPASTFSSSEAATTSAISAADVITPDTTPLAEILSSQGLTPGAAMPAANAIDPATTEMASDILMADQGIGTGGSGVGGAITAADVITPDTTPLSQIFAEQGLTEGAAMPPAISDISALDTSATAGLPTVEELSALSGEADLGLAGMGELSEVSSLTGGTSAAAGGTAAEGATAAGAAEAGGLAEAGAGGIAAGAGALLFAAATVSDLLTGGSTVENFATDIFGANTGELNPAIISGIGVGNTTGLSSNYWDIMGDYLRLADMQKNDPEGYQALIDAQGPVTETPETAPKAGYARQ